MPRQLLTLVLGDEVTAADYLAHVADPEPPALGAALAAVTVDAEPLDRTLRLELTWTGIPPSPDRAAALAGFAVTADVVAVGAAEDRLLRAA